MKLKIEIEDVTKNSEAKYKKNMLSNYSLLKIG